MEFLNELEWEMVIKKFFDYLRSDLTFEMGEKIAAGSNLLVYSLKSSNKPDIIIPNTTVVKYHKEKSDYGDVLEYYKVQEEGIFFKSKRAFETCIHELFKIRQFMPHLPLQYAIKFQKHTIYSLEKNENNGIYKLETLGSLFSNDKSPQQELEFVALEILISLLFTLEYLQTNFKICHLDLAMRNVLLSTINSKNAQFDFYCYKLHLTNTKNPVSVYIKNRGFCVKLIDFGMAYMDSIPIIGSDSGKKRIGCLLDEKELCEKYGDPVLKYNIPKYQNSLHKIGVIPGKFSTSYDVICLLDEFLIYTESVLKLQEMPKLLKKVIQENGCELDSQTQRPPEELFLNTKINPNSILQRVIATPMYNQYKQQQQTKITRESKILGIPSYPTKQ